LFQPIQNMRDRRQAVSQEYENLICKKAHSNQHQ
jgi:hypothetical protein